MHLNRLRHVKGAHDSSVWSLSWCPDDSFLTGSLDERVVLWTHDPDGNVTKKHTFLSHGLGTVFLSVHQDGQYAASSCLDGCVRVWDIQDHSKKLHTFQTAASENWGIHFAPVREKVILAVAGGSTSSISVYTLGEETKKHMTLRLPRFRDGQQQRSQKPCFVLTSKFSPDGKSIVGTCNNGIVALFDIETGKELFTFTENTTPVRTTDFTPNSEAMVTGSDAALLTFYDLKSGSVISTIDSRWNKGSKSYEDPSMFLDSCFHPNSVHLATCTAQGKIALWEMKTRERCQLIEDHGDAVWSGQFNSDGTRFVSVCEDGSLALYSTLLT